MSSGQTVGKRRLGRCIRRRVLEPKKLGAQSCRAHRGQLLVSKGHCLQPWSFYSTVQNYHDFERRGG
jgi:hypothetical protein